MGIFGISASAIGTGFRRQSVIANNLANSVTSGFKARRTDLVTLSGGGVGIGAIRSLLGQGPIEVTGIATDLAIDGPGFFRLRDGSGRPVFTRDGTFGLDAQGRLVNPANGFVVEGFNADPTTFALPVGGAAGPISVPIGRLNLAQATGTASFDGNLNGGGTRATDGSVLLSATFVDGGGGPAATAATPLTSLFRQGVSGPDVNLGIQSGDTITVSAAKGGRALPAQSFAVSATPVPGADGFGTTLGDLASFLEGALGINTGGPDILFGATRDTGVAASFVTSGPDIVGVTATGKDFLSSGVQVGDVAVFDTGLGAGRRATVASITTTVTLNDTINFAAPLPGTLPPPAVGDAFSLHEPPASTVVAGQVRVAGNVGAVNDLTNLSLVTSGGVGLSSFSTIRSGVGEGTLTSATVFDSLGSAHAVEVSFALESQGPNGNTFRFFAEAQDNAGGRVIGTGTVTFDTSGAFSAQNPAPAFVLNLPNQGAATPLSVTADFSGLTGFAGGSQVFLTAQDGITLGTLQDFSVGADGVLTGSFTNGATRPLAQVTLTRFANSNGLIALGQNSFSIGPNSGPAIAGAPGTNGFGTIRSGALEGSNVELARELVGQIINKSFTTANIKMIRVQDEILGSLLDIRR